MDIKEERNELFDKNFKCKTTDQARLSAFCNELTEKSKILCGTKSGKLYEYLPKIYNGLVKKDEV